jgi:hypothetical protein
VGLIRPLRLLPASRRCLHFTSRLLEGQPDHDIQDEVLDDAGNVLIVGLDFNADRDARIMELEAEFPHLVEPAQEYFTLITDEVETQVAFDIPTLEERRPKPTVDVDGFKETIITDNLRRAAYPPIGDQLDSIWKQLNYDRLNGRELIEDCDMLLGEVLAVKSKYRKVK